MLNGNNLSEIYLDLTTKARKHLSRSGVAFGNVITVTVKDRDIVPASYPIVSLAPPGYGETTSLLSSLSIIRECAAYIPDVRFVVIRVDYICLTSLGVELLIRCDRELAEVLRPSPALQDRNQSDSETG
jgi:hypothetical protein